MSQPPPPAPALAAESPNQAPAPFTGRPEDARILSGLRARREILSEQLEGVGERRSELVTQLTNTSFAEGGIRRGLEQRLQVLDERVVQLERDIVTTDRVLAGAPPQLLAEAAEPREVRHSGPSDEEVMGIGATGLGLGILLMLVAGRIRRWRRRGDRAAARDAAGSDPRIDRLSHAVDAIAVEVERIGEGQRFVTQLLAESRAGDSRPRMPEFASAADAAPTQGVPNVSR